MPAASAAATGIATQTHPAIPPSSSSVSASASVVAGGAVLVVVVVAASGGATATRLIGCAAPSLMVT
jgi:sugar/nucleoside kinase (ribokinase family)